MPEIDRHLTDEELLLAADGELPAARGHLFACSNCQARLRSLEAMTDAFSALHHATLDSHISNPAIARRRLQTGLSTAGKTPGRPRSQKHVAIEALFALAAMCLFSLILAKTVWHRGNPMLPHGLQAARDSSLPDRSLTPGRFQPVRLEDVCRTQPYEQDRVTSATMKRKVLAEYGMPANADASHEIDFLVIPELGGTEDIQNLWPEPYESTEWNAHVKDALEEKLHDMVCERKIDLATAQRDIATDWISAYKKYFHTDKPLYVGHSS